MEKFNSIRYLKFDDSNKFFISTNSAFLSVVIIQYSGFLNFIEHPLKMAVLIPSIRKNVYSGISPYQSVNCAR